MVKQKTIYVCEICNKAYEKNSDARRCEYKHMGINNNDKLEEYRKLEMRLREASSRLGISSNVETRREYNDAVASIVEFEQKNKITPLQDIILQRHICNGV